MSYGFAFSDVKNAVINKLQELHDGAYVDDEDLQEMLVQAWYQLIPESAKSIFPKSEFVSKCFAEKDEYLVALNGEYNPGRLSIVK
jgi:hypothetical protein